MGPELSVLSGNGIWAVPQAGWEMLQTNAEASGSVEQGFK